MIVSNPSQNIIIITYIPYEKQIFADVLLDPIQWLKNIFLNELANGEAGIHARWKSKILDDPEWAYWFPEELPKTVAERVDLVINLAQYEYATFVASLAEGPSERSLVASAGTLTATLTNRDLIILNDRKEGYFLSWLDYVINHKLERCKQRMSDFWFPYLENDPLIETIPRDLDDRLDLILSLSYYQTRAERG